MVDETDTEVKDETEDGDVIDSAFSDLIEEHLPETPSEDDWDDMSDDLYEVIESIEDDGLINGIPDEDASDQDKQAWLDAYLPVIRDKFTEFREGASNEQDSEEE